MYKYKGRIKEKRNNVIECYRYNRLKIGTAVGFTVTVHKPKCVIHTHTCISERY